MKKCLIPIILFLVVYTFAQTPKPAINYYCSLTQGFHFNRYEQDNVGHVPFFQFEDGPVELNADFTVTDPIDGMSSINVVGVMQNIYWQGGYADPIEMAFNVSTNNKNNVMTLIHTSLSNTTVHFSFNIYQYDPVSEAYFNAFHTNDAVLEGMITRLGGDLQLFIDDDPSLEVPAPQNFQMLISIMPPDFEQELHLAVSSTDKFVKQWGFGEPPPPDPPSAPTLSSPANGSNTTDHTPFFDWNDSSGATSYTIQVDNNSNFSSPEVNQSPTSSTYTPGSNLTDGTYWWRVNEAIPVVQAAGHLPGL